MLEVNEVWLIENGIKVCKSNRMQHTSNTFIK